MNSPADTRFQVAILADSSDILGGLPKIAAIEWLFCKHRGDHGFDFYRGDDLLCSIDPEKPQFDLAGLLGIVVIDGSAFEPIRDEWNSMLASTRLAFRQAAAPNDVAVLRAALECAAEALTAQRCQSGRAALELATYRREFERLQRNFSRLEEYVGRQSLQKPTEIFEYPVESAVVTEAVFSGKSENAALPVSRSLTQNLPVDSLGLCSVCIHISAKPGPTGPPLRVELRAQETGQVFGVWSISASEAPIGWIELALNSAVDEPALSLLLAMEWPPSPSGWALTQGPPHPYREFCAQTAAGQSLRSPLALRLFSSLPGVRVSATTTAIRSINAPHVSAAFIPYDCYGQVTQISPAPGEQNVKLVSYDPEIASITVHPQKGTLTVARLQVVPPKHAWGITAEIHLANDKANPTQFAILACSRRDESRELAALHRTESPPKVFSGWKTLSALERRSISALIPTSPERLTIFLATRQSPELSPDFGWARFSKLEFNLLPKSLTDEERLPGISPGDAEAAFAVKEQASEPNQ